MKISREIKRKIIQIAAFGYSNTYLGNLAKGQLYKGKWKQFCNPGINCYSCPAARLSCPIGAMQAVSGSISFKISFYVVGFVLALGVLFGRAICGFICPFGLIQELLYKIPFPKKRLWKGFTYVKYVILLVFVLLLPVVSVNTVGMGAPAFCEYICPAGTLEGGIPLLATHPELRQIIGALFSFKACVLLLTLIGCLMICRFFCKVMCPLGAIYGILNKISLYHMEINTENCVSCGKCHAVCPMDVNPAENPDSAECIRCGRCVEGCSRQALIFRFGRTAS
ncbi:4Fe-4S binding protein [Faecalicatena contorta]|uniref:4Fe-4S binding protein n=1 Tax=Faecalicatena contorta TaxID=39482 RepID=UPI001F3B86E8|nr:4Fe-4S binding protein [Faecalicatena contorta]MCF2679574.1 4Fe-4S binding protein [Faecalicatena contorta]